MRSYWEPKKVTAPGIWKRSHRAATRRLIRCCGGLPRERAQDRRTGACRSVRLFSSKSRRIPKASMTWLTTGRGWRPITPRGLSTRRAWLLAVPGPFRAAIGFRQPPSLPSASKLFHLLFSLRHFNPTGDSDVTFSSARTIKSFPRVQPIVR
jgi:hypothetical protein